MIVGFSEPPGDAMLGAALNDLPRAIVQIQHRRCCLAPTNRAKAASLPAMSLFYKLVSTTKPRSPTYAAFSEKSQLRLRQNVPPSPPPSLQQSDSDDEPDV